jgi:hypothetical protein
MNAGIPPVHVIIFVLISLIAIPVALRFDAQPAPFEAGCTDYAGEPHPLVAPVSANDLSM